MTELENRATLELKDATDETPADLGVSPGCPPSKAASCAPAAPVTPLSAVTPVLIAAGAFSFLRSILIDRIGLLRYS